MQVEPWQRLVVDCLQELSDAPLQDHTWGHRVKARGILS